MICFKFYWNEMKLTKLAKESLQNFVLLNFFEINDNLYS